MCSQSIPKLCVLLCMLRPQRNIGTLDWKVPHSGSVAQSSKLEAVHVPICCSYFYPYSVLVGRFDSDLTNRVSTVSVKHQTPCSALQNANLMCRAGAAELAIPEERCCLSSTPSKVASVLPTLRPTWQGPRNRVWITVRSERATEHVQTAKTRLKCTRIQCSGLRSPSCLISVDCTPAACRRASSMSAALLSCHRTESDKALQHPRDFRREQKRPLVPFFFLLVQGKDISILAQ